MTITRRVVMAPAEGVQASKLLPTSITKNTYTRFNVTAQSTWKKSHTSMLAA